MISTTRSSKIKREKCIIADNEHEENFESEDYSRNQSSATAERVRRLDTKTIISTKISRVLNYENFNENIVPLCIKTKNCEDNSRSDEPPELLSSDIEKIAGPKVITSGVQYSSMNRLQALFRLEAGDEFGAIVHLTKSHSVFLQSSIFHRYTKTTTRKKYCKTADVGLKPNYMALDSNSTNYGDLLRAQLSSLPEEWYVVQLTPQYEKPKLASADGPIASSMSPLHITIFPTGPNAPDPICITLPQLDTSGYDAVGDIVQILKNNKGILETNYETNSHYWTMRAKQDSGMKVAMMVLETEWLREWKILLVADPIENTSIVKEMRDMIDKLIADDISIVKISERSKWLLKKIATSACYLTKAEIARAVLQIITNNKKLASNVILSIYGKLAIMNDLRTEKRKPLILIVDESLDHIPFETMSLLASHPVTRFPSLNVAYAMFKEHESTIVKGCKIVKITDELGSFIINPGGDLSKTEARMKLFINYWLPNWKGKYGTKPDEKNFTDALVTRDILMYAGHGNGIQYLPGHQIEKLKIRSLPLLFGCSSVKLVPVGGRFPPLGVSNRYMIGCSPCVLGALWEITDSDTDKLTARFMSNWIPSTASRPWSDVDIDQWAKGILKFKTSRTDKGSKAEIENEPEMLRAIVKAKGICTQHMTAAAIVVRGLPIRLV